MKRLFNIRGLFGRKQRRIEELEGLVTQLEQEKAELEKEYAEKGWQLLCQASETAKQRDIAIMEAETLNKKLDQLKEKAKTEKKELKDKIKELEKQLEGSYKLTKLPSGRPRKGQTMALKRSLKQSNAIKLVKEKL